MKTVTPPRAFLSAVLLLAFAVAASAQGLVDSRRALSAFPDSQAVLFINVKRIVGEALPRLLPPAEYQKMIAEPQKVGFDVRGVEYAVAGVRFADSSAPSGIPEFVIVLKGNFNADSLLTLARLGLSTQNLAPREESYLNKPIQVFDLSALSKGADPNKPPSIPFKEVAAVAMDANTLVFGIPAYVRATMDAGISGQGQLKPSLVDLATRDPQALWSLSAELPPSLPEYLKKLGAPSNSEVEQMIGWFKQLSISNGMDALNFTMRAAVGTDSAEHASALSGIVKMGISAAQAAAQADIDRKKAKPAESRQAQIALSALRSFTNQTEGNTLLLGISVPQKAIAEVVQKEFVKKPVPATTGRRRRPARRR